MAKKKSDKETEPKKVSTKRFSAFFKNETTHFVIGLISVIFAVYLLLAFTSFFFTGAADQSILDNQQPGELMQTTNHVKNYAGARGAQLAEFLINECFGLAAYFIILFLAVVGMKLMKAYQFRIWKWFMSCSISGPATWLFSKGKGTWSSTSSFIFSGCSSSKSTMAGPGLENSFLLSSFRGVSLTGLSSAAEEACSPFFFRLKLGCKALRIICMVSLLKYTKNNSAVMNNNNPKPGIPTCEISQLLTLYPCSPPG